MNRLIPPLLALGLGLTACSSTVTDTATQAPSQSFEITSDPERTAADPSAPAEWTAGVNQAGWDFHRTLEGNAVSSPLSIGTAFSLLRAGASEPTDTALDSIFAFPGGTENEAATHSAANSTLTALEAANRGESILTIANQLFVRSEPLQLFVDTAAAQYGAPPVPLADDPGVAADEINGWVNDQTQGLIPEIVTSGDVTDSELVVVNTVYLHADWRYRFDAALTHEGDFSTGDGTVSAEFMAHPTPVFTRYVALDRYVAVELPYADGDLSMWIIVPDNTDGLEAVEASLDAATVASLGDRAREGSVELTMPKWEFALPPTNLIENWLCPEGLCAGAPTERISPGGFVAAAVHAAKIVVDEKGTEAAAATAIAIEASEPVIDLEVQADHPFAYAIVHEPTGSLVFVGRVTDPTEP